MSEAFIRVLRYTARDDQTVHGSIEDFQHHFEVTVTHDGTSVTSISGDAVRWPWSTCAEATQQLQALVGAQIGQLPRVPDPTMQCTHQLDLAVSAVRFAGSGLERRSFVVTVEGWGTPNGRAEISRNDGVRLEWALDGYSIAAPAPFAGHDIGAGFARWAIAELEPDIAETALLLRRAVRVAPMRALDLDALDVAADSGLTEGVCYTAQSQRLHIARRNKGMARVVDVPEI